MNQAPPTHETGEPTAAELAAIDREWPLIAAELELLDAEIAVLVAGDQVSELDVRRLRRAERRVLSAATELLNVATAARGGIEAHDPSEVAA